MLSFDTLDPVCAGSEGDRSGGLQATARKPGGVCKYHPSGNMFFCYLRIGRLSLFLVCIVGNE